MRCCVSQVGDVTMVFSVIEPGLGILIVFRLPELGPVVLWPETSVKVGLAGLDVIALIPSTRSDIVFASNNVHLAFLLATNSSETPSCYFFSCNKP